jgi:hypothetical protein
MRENRKPTPPQSAGKAGARFGQLPNTTADTIQNRQPHESHAKHLTAQPTCPAWHPTTHHALLDLLRGAPSYITAGILSPIASC